jgi:hypothetical protein
MFLQTNFFMSYGLARVSKAGFLLFSAFVITAIGRVLDTHPRNAPLKAVVYAKPAEILAMALLLALDMSGLPKSQPTIAAYSAFLVLILFLAPAAGLSSLAATIQIKRACVYRPGELDIRRALYQFRYTGAGNLASLGASGLIWLVLIGCERAKLPDAMAYRIVAGLAIGIDGLTIGIMWLTHLELFAKGRTRQPALIGSRDRSGWRTRWRSLDHGTDDDAFYHDPRDFDICKFDCSRWSWRYIRSSWSNHALWSFVALMTSLIGSYCLSIQIEDTQPTFIQNRFNDRYGS